MVSSSASARDEEEEQQTLVQVEAARLRNCKESPGSILITASQ